MTFQPTHTAPPGGLPTWDVPDPTQPPGAHLDAGLPVEIVQVQAGWTQIRCSNSWVAWIDGSRLVPGGGAVSPGVTGAAGAPMTMAVPTTAAAWTALAAGAAVALLSFLPWLSISRNGVSVTQTAWKVPAAILVDNNADSDGIKLALVLLLIGAVTAGLALYAPTSTFAWWAGGPILAVTLLYIIQLTRVPQADLGPGDVGFGAWLTGAVGMACLVIPIFERASNTSSNTAAARSAVSPASAVAPIATTAQPSPAPVTPAASPAATPESATSGWVPTHRVPASGARCYEAPDPASLIGAELDPGLSVAVTEETMGWAHITCSNGWTTWVDGRPLETLA